MRSGCNWFLLLHFFIIGESRFIGSLSQSVSQSVLALSGEESEKVCLLVEYLDLADNNKYSQSCAETMKFSFYSLIIIHSFFRSLTKPPSEKLE